VTEVAVGFLVRFLRSTAVLAMPCSDQEEWLSSLGLPGEPRYADELALEFDDGIRLLDQFVRAGLINELAAELLRVLDGLLNAMSGPDNADLWTLESLRVSPRWEAVRASARAALLAL
jgi:hypothetical protein